MDATWHQLSDGVDSVRGKGKFLSWIYVNRTHKELSTERKANTSHHGDLIVIKCLVYLVGNRI